MAGAAMGLMLAGCVELRPTPVEPAAEPPVVLATSLPDVRLATSAEPPLEPTPAAASIAPEPSGPLSEPLSCGLFNPMPGGVAAGYPADTGLDLAGMKSPVFALGAGLVDYAEPGHSLWTGRGDTDLAVRIELDDPIELSDGRVVTHVWYAHLFELAFEQPEGAPRRRRVAAGEYLGLSGRANGMWHLHLGLLLGGDTSQRWGSFLLEDEVRAALCGLGKKSKLPALAKKGQG